MQACKDAGARAFIAKPFAVAKLLDGVAEIALGGAVLVPAEEPRAAAPGSDDVLDASVLDEFAAIGMGPAFEADFIGQCVADARMVLARMRRAGEQADWDQVHEQAHALKGVSGNLGLLQVATHAGQMMRMTGFELARDWRRHCDTLVERMRRGEQALAARGNWRPAREDSH